MVRRALLVEPHDELRAWIVPIVETYFFEEATAVIELLLDNERLIDIVDRANV